MSDQGPKTYQQMEQETVIRESLQLADRHTGYAATEIHNLKESRFVIRTERIDNAIDNLEDAIFYLKLLKKVSPLTENDNMRLARLGLGVKSTST